MGASGERIKLVRKKWGLSQLQFGGSIGVSNSYISSLERGEFPLTDSIARMISEVYHVRYDWLTCGEGRMDEFTLAKTDYRASELVMIREIFSLSYPRLFDMISLLVSANAADFVVDLNLLIKYWEQCDEKGRARLEYKIEELIPNFVQLKNALPKASCQSGAVAVTAPDQSIILPIVGKAAAGLPIEMVEIPDETSGVSDDAVRNGDMIVIADGDSMIEAGIHNGDHCVIRPMPQVEQGQIALVAVGDGSTIKRFYANPEGYRLVSCNPAYPDQHYPPDAPIRILGRFIKTVAAES